MQKKGNRDNKRMLKERWKDDLEGVALESKRKWFMASWDSFADTLQSGLGVVARLWSRSKC